MIELRPARESEVILAFLKAEVDSPDYSEKIQPFLDLFGITRERLIDVSDLESECCNALRRIVLECYRGYLSRAALFTGFPKEVEWRRVELEREDLKRLKYIAREENWMSASQGTRLPQRVVERMARGELPGLEKKVCGIQEKLRRGELLPEIIAAEGEKGDLILIEGHCRATAYVGLQWSANIPIFIASSPFMDRWHFY